MGEPIRKQLTMTNKPIIPWMGGKRRLSKHILPYFGAHTTYVEPFCGGAALFFLKEESEVEVLNDCNGELVNLYRVVKNHLDEFLRHFRWSLVSRQEYLRQQSVPPDTLTDIQRAARFFYLQKLAYRAKGAHQTFGTSPMQRGNLNLLRIEEDLSHAHMRLARVTIERLDWAKCVEIYDRPTTLHYLDPPYWGTEGYGVDFGLEEYDKMAALARTVEGQMIISVGDCPEMRAAFDGLPMETLQIHYTVGGDRTEATELLITGPNHTPSRRRKQMAIPF